MEFDDDISGLQIEDLGAYLSQTELDESDKGFPLFYSMDDTTDDMSFHYSNTLSMNNLTFASPSMSIPSPLRTAATSSLSEGDMEILGLFTSHDPSDIPTMSTLTINSESMHPHPNMTGENTSSTVASTAIKKRTRAPPISTQIARPTIPTNSYTSIAGSASFTPIYHGTTDIHKRRMLNSDELPNLLLNRQYESPAHTPLNSSDSCSTLSGLAGDDGDEEDSSFRKKSREKMRRQEMNVRFDELVELLNLSNRARKSTILQEAATAIRSLQRERDDMQRDRDALRAEVQRLATCLQFSHIGTMAAASAVAFQQQQQQQQLASSDAMSTGNMAFKTVAHLNSSMSSLHAPTSCNPGGQCGQIGSAFGNDIQGGNSNKTITSKYPAIRPRKPSPATTLNEVSTSEAMDITQMNADTS